MIKQRIKLLETACKRVNAPGKDQYDEAIYRNYKRLYFGIDTAEPEETADSELIKAYEKIHGPQKNDGLIDRFIDETEQTTEY